MTVREELEYQEHRRLNPLAAFSDRSSGRPLPEEARADDVRTCYQRDIDRVVHSKAFRRLMHKTQVFLRPEGDHYRTRMTHTLEVSRIAGTITRQRHTRREVYTRPSLIMRTQCFSIYLPRSLRGVTWRRKT